MTGRADFICNWVGNQAWLDALEWSGKKGFNKEPLRPWYADEKAKKDKKQAGVYRSSGNLNFAVVDDSGHFVRLRCLHVCDLADPPLE